MDKDVELTIQKKAKEHHAMQMMALAMIHAGFTRDEILAQTTITNHQYSNVFKMYKDGNYGAISKTLIESWEGILKSKMISTTEKSIDKIAALMDDDRIKDAKDASVVFATLFDKFRLVTGQSTENISTITQRISQAIESRKGLQAPNQSLQSHDVTLDCTP